MNRRGLLKALLAIPFMAFVPKAKATKYDVYRHARPDVATRAFVDMRKVQFQPSSFSLGREWIVVSGNSSLGPHKFVQYIDEATMRHVRAGFDEMESLKLLQKTLYGNLS